MSDRTPLKAFGLILLIPSVFIGILPLLASYTDITSAWNSFTIPFGHSALMTYKSESNSLFVSGWIWLVAAIGEFILLAVHFTKPIHNSRFVASATKLK